MKAAELRGLDPLALEKRLQDLYHEEFSLRMERAKPDFKQTHRFSLLRKTIARILTILGEKRRTVA